MSIRWGQRLQLSAASMFLVGYAGLSHYSNSVGNAGNLGAVLALGPSLTIGFLSLWRWARPAVALPAAGAAALLLIRYWPLFETKYSWFYALQDVSLNLLLAATFGRSLLADHVPLCTQFADKVHGPLSPLEIRYTRAVTVAWTAFFAALASTTLVLFLMEPLKVWSVFSNFCSMPLIGLMFVAEFAVRRRVLPQRPRGGLLDTVRVYFASSP